MAAGKNDRERELSQRGEPRQGGPGTGGAPPRGPPRGAQFLVMPFAGAVCQINRIAYLWLHVYVYAVPCRAHLGRTVTAAAQDVVGHEQLQ